MDERDLLRALRPAATAVEDPVAGRRLWLTGVVGASRVEEGALCYDLRFTPAYDATLRARLRAELREALRAQGVTAPVRDRVVDVSSLAPGEPAVSPPDGPSLPPGVRSVVAVASGKGGVGKSTLATNLAVGLAARGLAVGLFDADVYGPSAPRMMGTRQRQAVDRAGRIVPVVAHGVATVSMGFVVAADAAMIWRGPMVAGAIRQLLEQTAWGALDALVVDLPPGTGDAQLTLVQSVAITGALIVTTPQEVALEDAWRGIRMFRELGVPVWGVVENMSWYARQDGTKDFVFGEGGGARLAAAEGVPLWGQIPLVTAVRAAGDGGKPAVLEPGLAGDAFRALCERADEAITRERGPRPVGRGGL